MEDDLTQNGRRPYPKWKMTSHKMEDDQKRRQKRRQPKMRMNKNEDVQK